MEGNRSFCFYLHIYALICSKYLIHSKSVDIRFISRRKYEGLNYRRRKLRNEKGIATTDALNKISISYGVKRNNSYHHIISIHGSLDFGWADHFTMVIQQVSYYRLFLFAESNGQWKLRFLKLCKILEVIGKIDWIAIKSAYK